MIFSTRIRRPPHHDSREGATTVEFAIISSLLFFTLFSSFEMMRIFVVASLADDAVFASLREVMIVGATIEDGVQKAEQVMAPGAVRNARIEIIPKTSKGVVQTEIGDYTASVRIRITIPMSANCFTLAAFTKDQVIVREAEVKTERSGRANGKLGR